MSEPRVPTEVQRVCERLTHPGAHAVRFDEIQGLLREPHWARALAFHVLHAGRIDLLERICEAGDGGERLRAKLLSTIDANRSLELFRAVIGRHGNNLPSASVRWLSDQGRLSAIMATVQTTRFFMDRDWDSVRHLRERQSLDEPTLVSQICQAHRMGHQALFDASSSLVSIEALFDGAVRSRSVALAIDLAPRFADLDLEPLERGLLVLRAAPDRHLLPRLEAAVDQRRFHEQVRSTLSVAYPVMTAP